jgi:hypothetical protein
VKKWWPQVPNVTLRNSIQWPCLLWVQNERFCSVDPLLLLPASLIQA